MILPSCTVDKAAACYTRGIRRLESRDVSRALECFDSAQKLGYSASECAAGRWDCWMLLGKFEQAWQESDFISALSCDHGRFWDGQSWQGKRVMLRCLHGLGDAIQFLRYAPLLKNTCRSLVVQTHPQLVKLVQALPAVDGVITWGEDTASDNSEWDMQMEVTELPRAFRTTLTDVPADIPYLRLPRERVQWASSLFREQNRRRIGIAWEAGQWNASRSIALEKLAPLFACSQCDFYVLQKGVAPDSFKLWESVHPLESHSADVRDTAALILNLDLVITVDTMTAHLAGALGKPVWILLPAIADWRWMLERRDTPWYPSARLFRQERVDDWSTVIDEVKAELTNFQASPPRDYLWASSGASSA